MTLAFDPPVSEAQRRAMYAAAAGRSTLGIPKRVGEEFVGKDAEKLEKSAVNYSPGKGDDRCRFCKHYLGGFVCEVVEGRISPDAWCEKFVAGLAAPAAGVMVRAPDGDVLFLLRSGSGDHVGEWCFPGGGVEAEDASTEAAARRELREETGYTASGPVVSVHDSGAFETFVHEAPTKFEPRVNDEHSEYRWANPSSPPQPLHPGVRETLGQLAAQDAEWQRVFDVALKTPKINAEEGRVAADESVRKFDKDGRLHVADANISKACVNPYLGREIPNWRALGLDPERRYNLFRAPEELARAAATFANLPLLSQHVPATAAAHPHELVVGTTGSEVSFDHPYLHTSISIWPRDAIEDVIEDVKRELSSSYHYRADMTPGVHEGERYDGVMRDIVGNHVALVKRGRAGSDVIVGDSATPSHHEENDMSVKLKSRTAVALYGALSAHLLPLLAADKAFDVKPLLVDVDAKNLKDKKAAIVDGVTKGATPLLAKDAKLDVATVFDKLALAMDEDDVPAIKPKVNAEDDEPTKFLKGKLNAEDYEAFEKLDKAKDAEEEEERKKAKDAEEKDMVSKKAMDAAITVARETATKDAVAAATKNAREIVEAVQFVRPWVGDLAVACDSGEAVYRTACETMGIKVEGVHPSAFKALIENRPKPSDAPKPRPTLALDAAGAKSFAERYPNASKIRNLGAA